MLDFICKVPVDLPGARRKQKMQIKNSWSQWNSNQQPWDLKSDARPTELTGLRCKLYYLNDLYVKLLSAMVRQSAMVTLKCDGSP